MPHYRYTPFDYVPPPELARSGIAETLVAIVGAGPIGLAAAIDLALQGVGSIVIDDNDVVSVGSRAICWAKRTLEIFDRLGVAERMVAKGVTWQVGRVYHGADEIYSFDLLPETGHKMPAFINLQQYYVEQYLVERCADFPDLIDLRWNNRLSDISQSAERVALAVETPDGRYSIRADYALACDGAKSTVRQRLGLSFEGQRFEDRFLIADVELGVEFPSERRFWFAPPFHDGQTALLHKQPDNIYRIDLQLGPDADPEFERLPENVKPRLARALDGRPFELDWVSIYTFRCARLERFVHDRVLFVGDSAHVVSPFGARGGNGGIHDVDNLCWKLAAVMAGRAGRSLIESYNDERTHGADENIRHSAAATTFMSPPDDASRRRRDDILRAAKYDAVARSQVNSGRLSTPCSLEGLSLQTPSSAASTDIKPGMACPDAPLPEGGWLLEALGGDFALLAVGRTPPASSLRRLVVPAEGLLAERFGEGVFLLRPDQHVAACWDTPTAEQVEQALARALGH